MKFALPEDFPDRLSPMLVKELRQGLRTKAFIGVFLTLQIILGIILLGAGTTASSDQAGETISHIIFLFFSISVIIIQPMRGISALSSEIKDNTIDMMVLTRLSAWRIVTGKWTAIVSQSALLLVTIIPYLILRYFFGGMNLIGEIVFLSLIFITSATLTAITVGLSAMPSIILRMLPLIFIPIGGVTFLGALFDDGKEIIDFFSLETDESKIGISIYIALCMYYSFFLLSIGATLIAPIADNNSTARRLIALVATITAAILGIIYVDVMAMMIAFFVMILLPVFTISLTEFNTLVPPVVSKFHQYGFIGKLLGLFLLPGWATGVFFCYLLAIIAGVSFFFMDFSYIDDEEAIIGMAFVSAMVFPALLLKLFKMQGPSRVSNYILMTAATGVISVTLLGIVEALSNHDFLWLFVWLPPVSMMMTEGSGIDDELLFLVTCVFNVIYFMIFFAMAINDYGKSIRELNHSRS